MTRAPVLGRPGLRVRIIRKVRAYAGPADISQTHRYYAFTGLAELSSAWLRTTEGLGLGAAEACRTQCEIVDAMDRPLAHVAYNGRIFACSPQGRIDHGQVLYDPRATAAALTRRSEVTIATAVAGRLQSLSDDEVGWSLPELECK